MHFYLGSLFCSIVLYVGLVPVPYWFSFFFFFLGVHLQHMEVLRLGVESEHCWPTSQLQQLGLPAASVAYAAAYGNARSPTHWVRPGTDPPSPWILVGFISATPQQEFLILFWLLLLCGIVWSQEAGFLWLLFLKMVLAIQGLLCFLIHFKIICSNCERCPWYFDIDCTKAVDCLGDYGLFSNINSSNPWTRCIYLLVLSSITFIRVL